MHLFLLLSLRAELARARETFAAGAGQAAALAVSPEAGLCCVRVVATGRNCNRSLNSKPAATLHPSEAAAM